MDPLLRQEVRFLTTRLGLIIREQAGERVFRQVEAFRKLSKAARSRTGRVSAAALGRLAARLDVPEADNIAHAFSLFFQLVNLCEERARVRRLQANPLPAQSLGSVFRELRDARVSGRKVRRCLDALEIQPVLTAHPTEARRRSVLNHLLRLAAQRQFEEGPTDEILEALWQTREVREGAVGPLHEVHNTLFFFQQTIFETIAGFYATFRKELAAAYPGIRCLRPFLTFASWVGGDRDGHPLVTPQISRQTVESHRALVLAHYDREFEKLIQELTHAGHASTPVAGPFAASEPLRNRLAQIRDILRGGQAGAFVRTLEQIREALRRQKARRSAGARITRLIDQARVFGLHLAELDFRDHSAKLRDHPEDLLQEFRTIRAIQRDFGEAAACRFILSMTRCAAEIISLLPMIRQTGAHVDLVPLFETIEDLQKSPRILAELWRNAEYRAHLKARGDVQEVMLGYSDSSKDGGYLAANWLLYCAQKDLSRLARKSRVTLRLFHGKGGSIDRGGGASHGTLRAQPHAAPDGRIRITEQGEVVSLKYSNPLIAQRNLEQLTSAIIAANCLSHSRSADEPRWERWMERLSRDSLESYQQLVYRTPELAEYFRQATPIDLIEHLSIGSRPSLRQAAGGLRSLRAIPWVFAWTQSRHLLSAWYGVGHALETFSGGQRDGLSQLRTMYRQWPFFASLLDNVEVSLAKTDLYIARRYSRLVRSAAVRRKIFGLIAAEHERAVRMVLRVTERPHLLAGQPVLAESISLRNPYVDPLNFLQIEFLRRWRRAALESTAVPVDDGTDRSVDGARSEAGERLRQLLALTVAGIAFGMKSTG